MVKNTYWKSWPDLTFISWNLTFVCNFQCVHCYVDARKGGSPTLFDVGKVREVAREARSLGVQAIFFGGGEPLILGEIAKFVRVASEEGLVSYISTNMSLITEELARKLLDAGIRGASVGVDHVERDAFDAFRGRGSFDKVLSGFEVCRKVGLLTNVDFTPTQKNKDATEKIHEFAVSQGCERVTLKRYVPEGRGWTNRDELMVTPLEHRSILHKWALMSMEYDGRISIGVHDPLYILLMHELGMLKKEMVVHIDCNAGGGTRGWLGISPNGNIHPCPLMRDVKIGNILDDTLEEALHHEVCQHMALDIPEECEVCEVRDFCRGGCKCWAVKARDSSRADPMCWRLERGRGIHRDLGVAEE